MHNAVSVEIDRPIEEVFEYTNSKVAEWSLTVVENHRVEDRGGVGDRFQCVTEEGGRRMEFEGTTTAWEPPYRSAVRLVGSAFDIEVEYLFEDLGGSTSVTQESTVVGKGVIKLMFFLFGWAMKKHGREAVRRELLSLKEKLESGRGKTT